MRTVYPQEMVAHLFANQSQPEARTQSGNFYFYGDTCYSYGSHYVAAVHHGDCVLVNEYGYSVTTAKHMSRLRSAISGQYFDVENPAARTKPEHRANFHKMAADYRAEVLRASRARVYNSLNTANHMLAQANAYAARFKIGNRLKAIETADIKGVIETQKKRDTAAARRAEKARIAAAAERAERMRAEYDAALVDWRAGLIHCTALGGMRQSDTARVRLSADGQTVETSQGAEFPARHARRWIQFVIGRFLSGENWARNGSEIRLGHFQIDTIDGAAGLLRAGCHTVTRAEVERLAELLDAAHNTEAA